MRKIFLIIIFLFTLSFSFTAKAAIPMPNTAIIQLGNANPAIQTIAGPFYTVKVGFKSLHIAYIAPQPGIYHFKVSYFLNGIPVDRDIPLMCNLGLNHLQVTNFVPYVTATYNLTGFSCTNSIVGLVCQGVVKL